MKIIIEIPDNILGILRTRLPEDLVDEIYLTDEQLLEVLRGYLTDTIVGEGSHHETQLEMWIEEAYESGDLYDRCYEATLE